MAFLTIATCGRENGEVLVLSFVEGLAVVEAKKTAVDVRLAQDGGHCKIYREAGCIIKTYAILLR
jgi:hypothetical protein